ncbi:MAG: protein phosphatase 2C domain-containing protein [Ruminococcus sp.]|nr:protein phosphatase 2C domain-containing protein [Ruminococcus sp.]
MSFIIRSDSICGMMHRETGVDNQDAIASNSNDSTGVIVLADGAGSRRYAQQGAKTAVDTVAEYLFEHSNELFDKPDTEIQSEVHSFLLDKLHKLSEEYGVKSIREFGSTLLFAVICSGRYMVGHLGDGSILSYHDDDFTVISYPENGDSAYSTVLTTSFQAKQHLRIARGNTADAEGIILLSDGILPFLFNGGYLRKNHCSVQKTLLHASEGSHYDDASYIMINWRS